MLAVIEKLEVVQEDVRVRQERFEDFALVEPAGVERGVDAGLFQFLEEREHVLPLQGRFPAGHRDAAVSAPERAVSDDHVVEVVDRVVDAFEFERPGRAFPCAGAAGVAEVCRVDAGLIEGDAVLRAGRSADAAADAQDALPLDVRARVDAFRVMAPGARQRAALQEHRGPKTRAVFRRHTLDVQNFHVSTPCGFLWQ